MLNIFSIENPENSIEWMIFLANKYSSMFWEGTKLTLFIAVLGTLLGFVLGSPLSWGLSGVFAVIVFNYDICLGCECTFPCKATFRHGNTLVDP